MNALDEGAIFYFGSAAVAEKSAESQAAFALRDVAERLWALRELINAPRNA